MGTDVHMILEVPTYNGKWKAVPAPDFMTERDYQFFAGLGNVRNGFGFAGVDIFTPIEPLTDSRGFPDDMGAVATAWSRSEFNYDSDNPLEAMLADTFGWCGDHSFGYCSASEFAAYDWSQGITEKGIVPYGIWEGWNDRDRIHRPERCLQAVHGDYAVVVSPEAVEQANGDIGSLCGENASLYVQDQWQVPLVPDWKRDKMVQFFKALQPFDYVAGGREVRLIFGFDS